MPKLRHVAAATPLFFTKGFNTFLFKKEMFPTSLSLIYSAKETVLSAFMLSSTGGHTSIRNSRKGTQPFLEVDYPFIVQGSALLNLWIASSWHSSQKYPFIDFNVMIVMKKGFFLFIIKFQTTVP